jgi:hypothetical protein
VPHYLGFYRTEERAQRCISFYRNGGRDDSEALHKAVTKTFLQLEKLLLPLYNLGHAKKHPPHDKLPDRRDLREYVVRRAALLSRQIHRMADVLYYWPPTFKDEEFDPARMEVLNLADMIKDSPYVKRDIDGCQRAELRPNHEDKSEAIVRIVAFPGIVAYRQGGGELGKAQLAQEDRSARGMSPDVSRVQLQRQQGENITEKSGFRTKLIAKATVHLQWGRQRLLTKEAGTSRHLDAMRDGNLSKYDKDYQGAGYVELFDLWEWKWHRPGIASIEYDE